MATGYCRSLLIFVYLGIPLAQARASPRSSIPASLTHAPAHTQLKVTEVTEVTEVVRAGPHSRLTFVCVFLFFLKGPVRGFRPGGPVGVRGQRSWLAPLFGVIALSAPLAAGVCVCVCVCVRALSAFSSVARASSCLLSCLFSAPYFCCFNVTLTYINTRRRRRRRRRAPTT